MHSLTDLAALTDADRARRPQARPPQKRLGAMRLLESASGFPGTKDRAHLVGLQKIWPRLRNRADLPDVRLHDLRHSFE